MIAQRKVGGVSDGYIIKIGNIEIAYNYYGKHFPEPNNICNPVFDFHSPSAYAPAIGAFKVDGDDWVVSKSGSNWHEPHPCLVSKFAKPKDRLPKEVFMTLFMQAYWDALIVESRRILDKLYKRDFKLC